MKLVMTLLVRDGADLIEQNLNFHLAQGVDHVVAIDNGSVDGTRDLLAAYERLGVATVVDEPNHIMDQARWMTDASLMARDRLGADWVLPNDVDEFWWCPTGTIKDRLASADGDALICRRKNMVYAFDRGEEAAFHERMIYRVEEPVPMPRISNIFEHVLPAPYLYLTLPPKLLLRTRRLISIGMGNHSATFDADASRAKSDILVYHYPIRSVAQFEQKVVPGAEARKRNTGLPKAAAWHWGRWYWLIRQHGAARAIADALPSGDRLARDIADGTVIEDRSLVRPLGEAAVPRPAAIARDRGGVGAA